MRIKTTAMASATFDGPARGVRCACAIADEIRPLDQGTGQGSILANAK